MTLHTLAEVWQVKYRPGLKYALKDSSRSVSNRWWWVGFLFSKSSRLRNSFFANVWCREQARLRFIWNKGINSILGYLLKDRMLPLNLIATSEAGQRHKAKPVKVILDILQSLKWSSCIAIHSNCATRWRCGNEPLSPLKRWISSLSDRNESRRTSRQV